MEKTCPRCSRTFNCNHEDILHCQCSKVNLTFAASHYIKNEYHDCLCGGCLRDINDNHHPYAMYVHGFGSGAASSSSLVVAKRITGYEWLKPELPLDPDDAISLLNDYASTFRPEIIVGTSMGGMFACYVNAPWAIKAVINPAMEMDKSLRKKGYGKFDFYCEREDGVQSGVIDEALIRSYEKFRTSRRIIQGVTNICVMSSDDELLGHEVTKKNGASLAENGFTVVFGDKFGHRLNEQTAKLLLDTLRSNS